MHRFKFKLGALAKSNISGFQGIITGRSWNHAGCDRYIIAPPMDEKGKVPDSVYYDDVEIEIIESAYDMTRPELSTEFKYQMLDEAKCTITGLKGKITGFVQYLNGCKSAWLQPKIIKDMNIPDGAWVTLEDVKITKAYKSPKPKQKKITGGPPSSIR